MAAATRARPAAAAAWAACQRGAWLHAAAAAARASSSSSLVPPSPPPVLLHADELSKAHHANAAPPPPPPPAPLPPLVWLHGLLGSGINFRSVATHPALTAGGARRCITVDLRNHGRSPRGDGAAMTLEAMADDVAHTLDALGVQRAAAIGHSLGGRVAALLALRHPARVAQLVVLDVSLSPYRTSPVWDEVARLVAAAAALDVTAFKSRRDIDAALAPVVPNAGMRSFLQQNLVPRPDGSYYWRLHLPSLVAALPNFAAFPPPPPAGPYQPQPSLPVAVISGALSGFVTPADRADITAFFPAARFLTLSGAGHWMHADKPADFVAMLAGALAAGDAAAATGGGGGGRGKEGAHQP